MINSQAVNAKLNEKYNVAAPRYTSYPTVPYWDTGSFDVERWKQSVGISFNDTNDKDGISLYIHLPYCENLCTYCGCNTRITKNHRVEQPYIKAVLKEWEMYLAILNKTPIIREIHLGGGTPTFFSPRNLGTLINGLLDKGSVHPKPEFSFEAHPANTTVEHLQVLHNLGFTRLSLGIQDFDPRVQFIINRHQTFEQVQTVTNAARDMGYTSINFDLIYGLPLQTMEGLAGTMRQVSELMPNRIAFYSYAHVPWLKPGQRRFTEAHLPNAHDKNKLYEIGRGLLRMYGYKEIGMDHFALPGDELLSAEENGKLHRNFMGYRANHTLLLIGLGVSSISDSWYGFSQNVKVVEDYMQMINSGDLPVCKGHILTGDDLTIRRHILNMMCKGETTWGEYTSLSPAVLQGVERLQALAEDGLVELTATGARVTLFGKNYLRIVCMALDARLWANKPTKQLFSMAV